MIGIIRFGPIQMINSDYLMSVFLEGGRCLRMHYGGHCGVGANLTFPYRLFDVKKVEAEFLFKLVKFSFHNCVHAKWGKIHIIYGRGVSGQVSPLWPFESVHYM